MNEISTPYVPKIFGIPDPICERAGIIGKWISGDKLGIHAFSHVTADSPDKPSAFENSNVFVHLLKLDVVLFEPVMRKLVNESNGTFLAVQNLKKNKNSQSDVQPEFLKLSRQYRSIVRACLENLQEIASTSPSKRDQYQKYVAIFYNIEYIWHLCEILFINITPGDTILPQLLEWIRFHFPKCDQQTNRVVASIEGTSSSNLVGSGGAESHPEYWQALNGLVLQGRVGEARGLLRLHSSSRQDPFRALDEALRTMPVYAVYGGLSVNEFEMRWKCWQVSCNNKIDAGVFSSWPQLEFIALILTGHDGAFNEAVKECESWEQLLAAWLLYTDPTVKSFHLGSHAQQCISQFRGHGGRAAIPKPVDSLIISLMESNLHQVIKQLQQTAESGWFATHLTDLLYHCGRLNILDGQQNNVAHKLREFLLLDYGTMLLGHHSLWQVGVSYLDHCPNSGEPCLSLLLPQVPLTSEKRAIKVIQIAKQRDLRHVVLTTCKVMGKRALARGQCGLALAWALRSEDAGFATHLADRFLEGYSSLGEFASESHSYLDLLDNLGSCMLISGRLTFLGKYCEFHRLYNAGDFREAAALLVSLLSSHLAPKYFWMTLLMDAVPLLESNDVALTSDDSYALMHCLEELISDKQSGVPISIKNEDQDTMQISEDWDELLMDIDDDQEDKANFTNKGGLDRAFKRKEAMIRVALARNMARAVVHEMSGSD
ncbi:nuclear pore complex protein Nup85 [Hetaerina americana]|uniref:nuclear pore complex protein Nup85 n=1 Tax=Hetaerina americana TaxID=62018 RepID=UPI003A7F5230